MHVAEKRRGRLQHRRPGTTSVAEVDDSTPPLSAASAAGIFAEGSRFGAYVIGPCIGHGGMARIYRAEHEGLCRQVALKVLTDGMEPGTEGRARFLREARIAAAIKHPNVVNIFDIGVENQVPYLVMELLVGQDLESLLGSHGALSEHTIIDIIVPVVAGLVAVHDAGIVHRDLKPGNIFLSKGANEEVEPKLLDFGISKASGGAEKMRLTSTQGLMMGTPLYMSPEALLAAEMTAASDQYSLGVVLYECATGVNPFVSDSVAETARRVTTGQYTPIAEQAIRPSRRLQMIIERMMSLDPKERYRDMRALGQELLTLAGQRTRITWGLTFGEVAAAVRQHARELDEDSTALARTRAPIRSRRSSFMPLLGAAAVGVAAVAAVLNWPAKRDDSASEGAAARASAPPAAPAAPRPLAANEPVAGGAAPVTIPVAVPRPSENAASAAAVGPGAADSDARELERAPRPAPALASPPRAPVARAPEREPRNTQHARPAPRAEASEPPSPEAPEWIIERAEQRARSGSAPVQIGTNDAPIFD